MLSVRNVLSNIHLSQKVATMKDNFLAETAVQTTVHIRTIKILPENESTKTKHDYCYWKA